ncbi:hypothetical protein [Streptomyces anandii]|uniref:hypothetical protein n=1 Tax=Streptomyces anandii TaxID=285454 RepID=UPI000B300843|nr:hypothetical protein [Streptomyces anandii]GGX94758.1 hypothetical protein GCM10010510_45010 [Streptomyces anandii JCM 4720]
MTTPTTHRDRLAGHLAEVENWILGARFDVQDFEKQIAEAERTLPNATNQCEAATASGRAVLGDGLDSVAFRSDIDRQVATCEAVMRIRIAKTNLEAARHAVDVLKAKQANARTTLLQAQALKKRIQLVMEADELPSAVDELEALMEN